MLKGFRDFVMRGNIVDLAIAVVIGTAFAKVVDTVVTAVITPILNALPGVSVNGLSFALRGGALAAKTTINVSAIISSVIVFVLTAAVVYFVFVVPMTRIQQLRARGQAPEPEAVPEATLLLREIRDALGARPLDGTAGSTPQQPIPDGGPRSAVMRWTLSQVPVVTVFGGPVPPPHALLVGGFLRQDFTRRLAAGGCRRQ